MTDTAKEMSTNNTGGSSNKTSNKRKGPELLKVVQKQIEFYLSRENLQNDSYLVQQMDASLYVPVQVIASFPKIASLTRDMKVILKAMKTSKDNKVSASILLEQAI